MLTAATSWITAAGTQIRDILGLVFEQGKAETAVFLGVLLTGWIFWCRRCSCRKKTP